MTKFGYKGLLLPVLAVMLLAAPAVRASVIWGNVSVLTNTAGHDTVDSCCQVNAIYDEQGLITPYTFQEDWNTYMATNPLHTDNPINLSCNPIDPLCSQGFLDNEWFSSISPTASPSATMVLDMGEAINISDFAVWNVNILNLTVNVCTGYSGFTSSVLGTLTGCNALGSFNALTPNLSGANYAAQAFSGLNATGEYVELIMTANNACNPFVNPPCSSNYDTSIDGTGFQLALGSVAFGTSTPEPNTGVLMGLGIGLVGFGRWIYRRRVVKSFNTAVN